MSGAVGLSAQAMGAALGMFSSPADYERRPANGQPMAGSVRAFVRGLRGEELMAAAQQFDHFAVCTRADLAASGLYPPQRFDRITVNGRTYTVQDWRPAPTSGDPVFVKLLVRGP